MVFGCNYSKLTQSIPSEGLIFLEKPVFNPLNACVFFKIKISDAGDRHPRDMLVLFYLNPRALLKILLESSN